jgi:hypothetical protein
MSDKKKWMAQSKDLTPNWTGACSLDFTDQLNYEMQVCPALQVFPLLEQNCLSRWKGFEGVW